MRRALMTALVFTLGVSFATPASAQQACTFQLGFQAIVDQIPTEVGRCLEDEHFNPANGDAEQRTTAHHGKGGLLVWRKADNWTAYTDGYRSWVNGPYGLQKRLNTECFSWEAGCGGRIELCVASATAGVRDRPGGVDRTVYVRATDSGGRAQAAWSVGGPQDRGPIRAAVHARGCTATAEAGFRGSD